MLSRLIIIVYCLNIFFVINNNDFILSVDKIDDSNIYLSINRSNFNCELDEKKVIMNSGNIIISKNSIKKQSSIIIFYNNNYDSIYKYRINYLGNHVNIHIDKNNYYLGYYLEGLDNISLVKNYYVKKVSFININNNYIRFQDTLDFNFSFLPIIKTNDEIDINSEICLFIDSYYLDSYHYYFDHYRIPLNTYYYDEVFFNNQLFIFPKNYKVNDASLLIYIYIEDVVFYYNYNINFNNIFYNSNYVNFVENNEGVTFEKNLLHN